MISFLSSVIFSVGFAASILCPVWKNEVKNFRAEIANPALDCRATCKNTTECIVQADPCGRRYTINKEYSSEMKEAVGKLNVSDCPSQIKLPLDEKAECVKHKCQIQHLDCKSALAKSDEFFKTNFRQQCKFDRECSFVLKPNEKCVEYLPVNSVQNELINAAELSYVKDKVIQSCLKGQPVYCPKKNTSQCFANQCIQVDQKIPFVSYLNFEGVKGIANFKSRTEPIKVPALTEIKCQKKSDCEVVVGVCSQYAVTLNKIHVADFKEKIKEFEVKVACPVSSKLNIPSPECFSNFCVFKE